MNHQWIPITEQRPTESDADFAGCVLWYHEYQGGLVGGWHLYQQNRFLTHWMPLPGKPAEQIKIQEDQTP